MIRGEQRLRQPTSPAWISVHSSEIGKDRQFFLGYPPGSLAIGVMGLDRESRYFFEFKGLAGEVFQKQRLSDGSCGAGCQRASQSGMAAASRGRLGRRAHIGLLRSGFIVANDGLDVCDAAHRLRVMKKSQRPRPSGAWIGHRSGSDVAIGWDQSPPASPVSQPASTFSDTRH